MLPVEVNLKINDFVLFGIFNFTKKDFGKIVEVRPKSYLKYKIQRLSKMYFSDHYLFYYRSESEIRKISNEEVTFQSLSLD